MIFTSIYILKILKEFWFMETDIELNKILLLTIWLLQAY